MPINRVQPPSLNRAPIVGPENSVDRGGPPADAYALAVTAAYGLPVSEYNKIRQAYESTGNLQQLINLRKLYEARKDEEAGRNLAQLAMQGAEKYGYDRKSGYFDPSNPNFKLAADAITREFYASRGKSFRAGIVQGVASQPLPWDATPEEIADQAAALESPELVLDKVDQDFADYSATRRTAFQREGATGGILESLGGGMIDALMVPQMAASYKLFQEFNPDASLLEKFSWANALDMITKTYYAQPTEEAKSRFMRRAFELASESNAFWSDASVLQVIEAAQGPSGVDSLSDPQRLEFLSNMVNQGLNIAGFGMGVWEGAAGASWRGGLKLQGVAADVATTSPATIERILSEDSISSLGTNGGIKVGLGTPEEKAISQAPIYRFNDMTEEQLSASAPWLGDVPQTIKNEEVRLAENEAVIRAQADAAYANSIDESAAVAAIKRENENFEANLKGTARVNLSETQLNPDGTGFKIRTSIGRNNRSGWTEKEALLRARSMTDQGYDIRLYQITKGKKEYLPSDPVAVKNRLKAIESGDKELKKGVYLEVNKEYTYSPRDSAAFGDVIVKGWMWAGRWANNYSFPSAFMTKKLRTKYTNNVLLETSIIRHLEQAMEPIHRLTKEKQMTLNQMLEWAESNAKTTKAPTTLSQLIGKFGDQLTSDLVIGFHAARNVNDIMYKVTAKRVRNALGGENGLTLMHDVNGSMYHGARIDIAASKKAGGFFLDPETGTIKRMSHKELDKLYNDGGFVLRSPLAEKSGNSVSNYIAFNPKSNPSWHSRSLVQFPLKYEPDYRPRVYMKPIYVYKVTDGVTVNGLKTEFKEAVGVAGSQKEAADKVAILNANSKKPKNVTYIKGDDNRLVGVDQRLADIEALRADNRLLYGDKGEHLKDVEGNLAEVVDPINMMLRHMRIIARQVSMEDLSRFMFTGWKKEFKDVVKAYETQHGKKLSLDEYGQVTAALKEMANNATTNRAGEALLAWEYINSMRGVLSNTSGTLRRWMVAASEGFYNFASSVGIGKFAKTELTDRIARLDPAQALRTISFYDYIVFNPAKQALIQGLQPMFIAPLVLKDALTFRWTLNAGLLAQGVRRLSIRRSAGKDVYSAIRTRNAKLMKVTPEEYDLIVTKLEDSGLLSAISGRNWGSDFAETITNVPKSKFGKYTQYAAKPFKKIGDLSQEVGFNFGEGINVLHSYSAAILLKQKEKGFKGFSKMTDKEWNDLILKTSDLSGGMNRANRAAWQNDAALSTLLQYMQFFQKSAYTMFGMNRGAFTSAESAKIFAHQALGWGASGIPLLPFIIPDLEEHGISKEWAEKINYGLYDFLFDKAFQLALQDPDVNFDFARFAAPGAGTFNTIVEMYEAMWEGPIPEWVLGPSGDSIEGIYEGVKLGWDIFSWREDQSWEEYQSIQEPGAVVEALIAAAEGGMSGLSHVQQARMALKLQRYQSKSGKLSPIAIDTATALVRAFTGGLRLQDEQDMWKIAEELSTVKNPELLSGQYTGMTNDAREIYNRMARVLIRVGDGTGTMDEFILLNKIIKQQLTLNTPMEALAFKDALRNISNEYQQEGKSLPQLLAKAVTRGQPIPEWIINRVLTSKQGTEDERKAVANYIRMRMLNSEQALPLAIQNVERESEILKNLKEAQ